MTVKLHARQQGSGAHLISLHGLFGSLENLGMINRILGNELCVHGLDLRNHGRSPHSREMNYVAMAGDVLEYLDEQQLDQVYLLGHSMGGKVAMTLALKHPRRIAGLVVIDIAPVTYYQRHHDRILAGLSSIDLNGLSQRNQADQHLSHFVAEKEIRQFLLKNLYKNDQGLYGWRANLGVIAEHYQEIMSGQQSEYPFKGKTLFIKAGDSDYLVPEHQEVTLKLFPNAQVKIITGAGHWVHAQKPDLVSRTILRFLTP